MRPFAKTAPAVALLAWLAWACTMSPSSDIRVDQVVPSQVAPGYDGDVEIQGSGFDVGASRSVSCGGSAIDLDDGYEAAFGDTALQNVVWVNDSSISARVPGTLAVGVYDLTITKPSGGTYVVEDAFEVIDGSPDTDTDADTDADTDSDSDSDSDTDVDTDTDADTDSDSDSDSDSDTDADTDSDNDVDTDFDAGTDAGVDAGADAGADDGGVDAGIDGVAWPEPEADFDTYS